MQESSTNHKKMITNGANILPKCIQQSIKKQMPQKSWKGGPTGGSVAEAPPPYNYLFRSTLYQISGTNLQRNLQNGPAARLERARPDLKATPFAADPFENSCWWILFCLLVLWTLWVSWVDRWIDQAVSITREAYDALFAKLVSLVAYFDSRRSENQRILRDQFHWLTRFVF